MGEEINSAVIKKTQDTLGKFIKRPPLTDKLLRKPPFRFLHDVVTAVVRETKFLDGLFSDSEMNSENVVDKESKMAFLQKVIDVVNIACGVSLSIRPAKVVAGYEPEKTNELLQIIGRAIEKKVDSSAAIQKVLSKAKGSKETVQPTARKSHTKKEEQVKPKKASQPASEKKVQKEKTGSDASKPKVAKANAVKGEEKEKRPSKEESRKAQPTKDKKLKKNDDKPLPNAKPESREKPSSSEKASREKKSDDTARGSGKMVAERGRRGSSAIKSNEVLKEVTEAIEVAEAAELVEEEGTRLPTKKASLDANDVPEVEDTFTSLEPPISERENVQVSVQEANKDPEAQKDTAAKVDTNVSRAGSHKKRLPMTAMPNEELRSATSSGQRVAISTPVVRPSSAMSRGSSRPRSARPHAPRLRSALGGLIPAEEVGGSPKGRAKEGEEGASPPQAGVMPIGDAGADDAEAAEFLVEEARPPSVPMRPVSLEAGPEGGVAGDGTKQQGLLVAKILETKKELESGAGEGEGNSEGSGEAKRVEIEYSEEAKAIRKRGTGEVEYLQSMVQAIARSAHPLGSLLGVLQENVDSMRSEMAKWRAETERLFKVLKEEERQMELELEPLRSVLLEVEQRVIEEREAVSAAKLRVLKAEQRIHSMLDPKGGNQASTTRVL